jgi:hypothetical protein
VVNSKAAGKKIRVPIGDPRNPHVTDEADVSHITHFRAIFVEIPVSVKSLLLIPRKKQFLPTM